MGEINVFDLLERVEKVRTGNRATSHESPEIYCLAQYLRDDIEPAYDLGEMIRQESRKRDLTDKEKELAIGYFEKDLVRTYRNAVQYLRKAQTAVSEEDKLGYLEESIQLTARSFRDAQSARQMDPHIPGIAGDDYASIFTKLTNLQHEIQLTSKISDRRLRKQVLPVYIQLQNAIASENYESAARHRDELRAILPNYK